MRFVKLLIIFLRQIPVSTFNFALISFAFVAAQAQPGFVRKDFPVSGSFLESGALTIGDFNGDGKPDLAVASTMGISVLLNQGGASGFRGSETRSSPRSASLGKFSPPISIVMESST